MRRPVAVAAIALFLMSAAALAQRSAPSPQYPYGFDPYKPSDAEWLRMYGSALTAQTPIEQLRWLDPYKPSDAALLRSLGGGIPLWWAWYPDAPFQRPASPTWPAAAGPWPGGANTYVVQVNKDVPASSTTTSQAAPAAVPRPTAMATVRRPESNDGIWIEYEGRRWISSGIALPFDSSAFTRVGEYRGFPVFNRSGSSEDVIYLPTAENVVARFHPKAR